MGMNPTPRAHLHARIAGGTTQKATLTLRTSRESAPGPVTWFAWAWPIVVFFHLAANPGHLRMLDIVALVQVLWLTSACVLAVSSRRATTGAFALPVMFIMHICVYLMKVPWVGNHELLMLLVEFAGSLAVITRRHRWMTDWATATRALLVVAYTAFAFSKLNMDFFDRTVSCAVVFADELGLPVRSSVSLSAAVIAMTVAAEVSIAVLLWFPKTRQLAAIIGLVFHWLVALEPKGHVFDFSAVLFVMFGLCIPSVEQTLRRAMRMLPFSSSVLAGATMLVLAAQILVTVNQWTFWAVAWPLWVLISTGWIGVVLIHVRTDRGHGIRSGDARAVDRRSVAWWAMIVLAGLNAFSPYVGMKSATSFNMYSNLRVTPGPSNHLIMPDNLAVIDYPDSDLVRGSDNPFIQAAAIIGLRVPEPNVAMWAERVAGSPPVSVSLSTLDGDEFSVWAGEEPEGLREAVDAPATTASTSRSTSGSTLTSTLGPSTLGQRLFVTRSVTPDGPQQCRRGFWPFL